MMNAKLKRVAAAIKSAGLDALILPPGPNL